MSTLLKNKRNIKYLEFELNNQCQNAQIHKWCPRYELSTKPYQELTTTVILDVMDQFQEFDGSVYFSNYNEPTMDKRLPELIKRAKERMPKCKVDMFSNGIGLTLERAKEYFDCGLDILRLSSYSKADKKRMVELAGQLGRTQIWDRTYAGQLGYDERIKIYDRDLNCTEPCYMPIQYFMICCNGSVIPCFDDWRQTIKFGNVYHQTVDQILMNPLRLKMIEELKEGKRHYIPCRGCDRPTEMCIQQYRQDLEL